MAPACGERRPLNHCAYSKIKLFSRTRLDLILKVGVSILRLETNDVSHPKEICEYRSLGDLDHLLVRYSLRWGMVHCNTAYLSMGCYEYILTQSQPQPSKDYGLFVTCLILSVALTKPGFHALFELVLGFPTPSIAPCGYGISSVLFAHDDRCNTALG